MKKFVLFVLLIGLGGCVIDGNTAPSSFYLLTSIENEDVQPVSKNSSKISVDVTIPGYIDRPQIVTKGLSDIEYDMSEFNRWLEALRTSLQRVVAENMSSYLPNAKIKPVSMGGINPDYKVVINVDRMDGRLGEKSELRVWWSIINRRDKVVSFDNITLETDVGLTYHDYVESQSELVYKLSGIIAKKISSM